jgi:predicted permease
VVRDVRFSFRALRKRPAFALAAVLTLAVGTGMTTTMFTLVDAVILRPLPGTNAEGMFYLELESDNGRVSTSPTPEFLRLIRDHASSFSRVEAYATQDYSIAVDGEPSRVRGGQASEGFFSFLGVGSQLGRTFLPGDGLGSGTPVVVLSHTFWAKRFGERADVLGRVMVIGGRTHEIVGVLPRDFRVDTPEEALLWIPEGAAGDLFAEGVPLEGALARLTEGVSVESARAELDALVQNNPLARRADMGWVGKVYAPGDLIDPALKKAMLILQAGAVLVLLIACGNLTNLLLAQGETRARELALRASLGAGRGRLVRQLLVECGVLGALGGVGGVFLTIWALEALPLFLPPGYAGFSMNGEVLLFSTAVSMIGVLVAGLLPSLKGSRRNLSEVMKGAGGHRRGRTRNVGVRQALVSGEVAMAFVLLVSAGLLLKSFSGLMTADVGFPPEELLSLRLDLPLESYGEDEARLAFLRQLRDEIGTGLPSQVGSATVATGLVEGLSAASGPVVPEGITGGDEEDQLLITWGVAPDYFEVVGVTLAGGRGFREGEGREGEELVIVNQEIASRFFAGQEAVGRRLRIDDDWYRIVGVAGSVDLPALAQSALGDLQVFFPLEQDISSSFHVLARVGGDRGGAVERLKEAVWRVDPSLPILDVSMVEDALAESLNEQRSNAMLMILFALTALSLGAVGIYGVVAYTVGLQIREIGIRVAVGATQDREVARVLWGGMRSVGLGLILAAAGFMVLSSTLSGLLHQVSSRDPFVISLGTSAVVAVSLLSTWLPARRAAGSDPVNSLKGE